MKSILDPSFKYVPAALTDIRRTFNKIRREQAAAKEAAKPATNVAPITQRKGKTA